MLNVFLIKKLWLKQEEIPIVIIRNSLLNWLWSWLIGGLMLLAAFFLLFYLWQQDLWGPIVFGVLIVVALLIFARAYWQYYYTAWILTNLRLVDFYQKGFFHHETSEVIYDKIQEVFSRKEGFFCGLFNLGDVYVTIAGSKAKLKLNRVRSYDRAVAEILLQQEDYQKNLLNEHERRAEFLLLKIKQKIGVKAFNNLIGD